MTTLSAAIDEVQATPEKRVMRILDQKEGDIKIIWDPEVPTEVDHARETFRKMTKEKGMAAYRVDKKGERAKLLKDFDPDAEAMILAPLVQGG